jgi:hypothetical protein
VAAGGFGRLRRVAWRRVTAQWRVTPADPRVDAETEVEATLVDVSRQPILHARVTVEAHMSHAGMSPIVEPAVERGHGVYVARLRLSMAGAWTLFVQVDRADRRSSRHRLGEIRAHPPAIAPAADASEIARMGLPHFPK